MIPVEWYLILSSILFVIGVLGVLIRRNAIIVLMCIELMLNSINLIFVAFSAHFGQLSAQVFVFFIMMIAAAEVAVGLTIFTLIYKKQGTIDIAKLARLKG